MSKNISKEYLLTLPSGQEVHPCRLIVRDGTLMWKNALLHDNELLAMPQTLADESHIIKTAQRLEELNTWVSMNMEPWESIFPIYWYDPSNDEMRHGISVYFVHRILTVNNLFAKLIEHIQDHEILENRSNYLFFKRC